MCDHIAAVFTMARAWIKANRPTPDVEDVSVPKLGSFEDWRHVVKT